MYLRSKSIDEVRIKGDIAYIKGQGMINKRLYSFIAKIIDGRPDEMGIEIYRADGTLYYRAEPQDLRRGNFMIEEKNPQRSLLTVSYP
jgi:hypothetical protein